MGHLLGPSHGHRATGAEPTVVHLLHPGDVVLALRGERMETLLGSCVAIILTDPQRTLGAMCHIVHSGSAAAARSADTCHGENALEHMFALLRRRAIDPLQCEAYVFGGGNMFPALFQRGHVGSRNIEWALQVLRCLGIALRDQDVSGVSYRHVGWTVGPDAPQLRTVDI